MSIRTLPLEWTTFGWWLEANLTILTAATSVAVTVVAIVTLYGLGLYAVYDALFREETRTYAVVPMPKNMPTFSDFRAILGDF